jgi:hypothetical protein
MPTKLKTTADAEILSAPIETLDATFENVAENVVDVVDVVEVVENVVDVVESADIISEVAPEVIANVTPEIEPEIPIGSFGYAIEALKKGYKIKRVSWSNSWVSLTNGKVLNPEELWSVNNKVWGVRNKLRAVEVSPYLTIKTEDNKIQSGWMPNQSDMLSEDWAVIED